MESFDEYCLSKKIDAVLFKQNNVELYKRLESDFQQLSPASFTSQKLFLINSIRRTYQLPIVIKEKSAKV